jgi:hypothetical protein
MVKEEASTMPVDLDIRDNELFKWGEEEGIAKGEARGEAIGEARGRAIGEATGEAKLLTKLLVKRFGPLPESIRTKIASADINALDRWVDRFADAESLDALFAE